MSRTIVVISGRDGAGKTSLALNLAVHLAELGCRVCFSAAGTGTTEAGLLLGVKPEYDAGAVISGEKPVHDVIVRAQAGIDLLPCASWDAATAGPAGDRLDSLVKAFAAAAGYDFYFFDTAAGGDREAVAFCLAAAELILVVTPEPDSLPDAYALLKVLIGKGFGGSIRVVVNRCPDHASAQDIYKKVRMAAERHFGVKVQPLGVVYEDEAIREALQEGQPFIKLFPQSSAAGCIMTMARRLLEDRPAAGPVQDMTTFWNRCFQGLGASIALDAGLHDGEAGMADRLPDPAFTLAPMFERLSAEVSMLSEELRWVREAMGGNDDRRLPRPGRAVRSGPETMIYRLDLQAFVDRHAKRKEGNG